LFSTPSSLWTLEMVSGSPQAVLTGQSFQPLVMRVTDGSSAANPVMGVNVTFATTLARVSLDSEGMPVILGSSQAQVVSAQNGTASIVPSAGSVGPCDVFITVSAGPSTAQLQMENLAAIVPAQSESIRARAPTAERVPQFGAQTPAPQGAPDVLFAVPQGALTDDLVASPSASDARQDTASGTDASTGATGNPGAGDVDAQSCESASESPRVETPRPVAEPSTKTPVNSTERDSGGGAAPQAAGNPSANQSSASDPSASNPSISNPVANKLLEDRRSCRFVQRE
jgi:hypothetical protein